MRGRVLDNTSDYGTMSNQVDDQYLDDLIPNLNLSGDSFNNETVFNDITVQERRDRIESIINDIMSVPKLAEAGLTQRGAVSQEKIRKYLSHENLSSRNVTSMSGGGGGGILSKNSGKTSSRSFGLKRTSSINRNEAKKENNTRQEIQIKDSIIPRNRINSTLNKQNQHEKKLQNGHGPKNSKPIRKPKLASTTKKFQDVTKKATEKLDMNSLDNISLAGNKEAEFSSHVVQLGQDTQEELAFHAPTLGDDTTQIQTNFSTSFETSTDMGQEFDNEELPASVGINSRNFLHENRNSAAQRKGSGRSTANSEGPGGSAGSRHKAGQVPKYLKQRQQQWKDEAQAIIDSAPDPDCPPGHVRLPEPDRLQQLSEMKSSHSALLDDLNRLPVSKDTRRVIEKRREIEGLLAGLDEGIRIYSRSKVFIKKPD